MTLRKNAITKQKARDLFLEQIYRAVENRGYIQKMFDTIELIEEPKDRVKLMLEMLKYVVPQLKSQEIEITTNEAEVIRSVVFNVVDGKDLAKEKTAKAKQA